MVLSYNEIRSQGRTSPLTYDEVRQTGQQSRFRKERVRKDMYETIFADGRVDSYFKLQQDELQTPQDRANGIFQEIESSPNPDEYRAKLTNALDMADVFGWDYNVAFRNHDAIIKNLWGKDTKPLAAYEMISAAKKEGRDLTRLLKDETFWESATRHTERAFTRAGMSLVKATAGASQIAGYLSQNIGPFDSEASDKMTEWGEQMSKGVDDWYKDNPQYLIRDVGDGFLDTTKKYLSDPWLIYEGVVETVPMMLEAYLGHITGTAYAKYLGTGAKLLPWMGRVQAMAAPITAQTYAELRDEGIPPEAALPHAILSGQGEALLEEWTLSAKVGMFKGAGKFAQKGMITQAARFLLGGAKAYGRGATEEGTQAAWNNFLRMAFVDPDQSIMDGVFSQAAAGGLIELTMAGGFSAAGKVRYGYNKNKSANDIVKNSNLTKEQAKEKLEETYQELYSELQNDQLTDDERNELFNKTLAGKIELTERSNVIIEKTEIAEQVSTPEGQVERLNQIREDAKTDMSGEDAAEVDTLIDDTISKIEAGELGEQTGPLTNAELQAIEAGRPIIDTSPQGVIDEINTTPRFGMVPTPSGDWIVVDYETQKEVGNPGGQRFIANQMTDYNRGKLTVKAERRAPLLPSEEKITKTTRQMFNIVMGAVSKASAQSYLAGARSVVESDIKLAKFANQLLDTAKADVTKAQRRTLLTAIANTRTPSQQIVAMATIQRVADVAIHAVAVKNLKKTIAFVNRKVGQPMQQGGIRPEYYARIQGLTDAVSVKGKGAVAKYNKAVASLKKHVSNMRDSMANQYERAYAEELLPPRLFERVGEIPVKSVQDMSADDILELNDALKAMLHLNATKNKIILNKVARDAAAVLNRAVDEMANVVDASAIGDARTPPDKRGRLRTLRNWTVGRENHDMETLADTIAGGQFGVMFEIIPEALSYGRGVQADYVLAANDVIRNTMATNNINIADMQQMSPAFFRLLKEEGGQKFREAMSNFGLQNIVTPKHTIDIGKTPVKFTMAELMSFYMHGQNSYNLKEIIKSGIAVRAGNTMNKIKDVTAKTFQQVADIVTKDPKVVALMDAAAQIHETIGKPAINKVSIDLKGIELAQVDNYWHIERWSSGGVAGTEAYRISLLESEGRLQERTGGKNPIKVLDFFEVLLNDIQSISEYVGMAKPFRSIHMLLNYKPLREAIKEKGYEPHLKNIDSLMLFTEQNINSQTKIDGLFGSILRGTTRAVLASPHIMIGQYVSTGGYFLEADIKYAKELRIAARKTTVQRYYDNWSFARLRHEGGLTSRVMGEIARSDRGLRAFTSSKDASNFFLGGINHVDSRAIIEAGRITEAEMADKGRKGKSKEYWERQGIEPSDIEFESEDYWDAFRKRATYLVRRTQPMFYPESRSVLTASKEPTKRMFTMFRSYIDQPLRMMARSWTALQNGKSSVSAFTKQFGLAMSLFMFHSIITDIIKNVMFNEDKEFKDYILNALTSPLGALTFIGFPLESMIQRAVETSWGERPGVWKPRFDTVATSWLNSIIDASNDIALAIAFAGSDERFKSGPNRGKLKSGVYLMRGLTRGTEEGLRYVGIPAQVPRKAYNGWLRENKKDEFLLPVRK